MCSLCVFLKKFFRSGGDASRLFFYCAVGAGSLHEDYFAIPGEH